MPQPDSDIAVRNAPPQDLEAEQMVLGAVLIEQDAIDVVKELLRPQDFYATKHEKIFTVMLGMREREVTIDLVTLPDAVRSGPGLEAVGGVTYLAFLVSQVPSAANIQHHARIVKRMKQLREISRICAEARDGVSLRNDPEGIITSLVAAANDVRTNESHGLVTQKELILFGYSETEKRYEQKGKLSGIPTGFRDLDEKLEGLQNGDLVIIAGRPSMGKSAFAECIADNAARHFMRRATEENTPLQKAGFISIEMSKRQLALRALSRTSGVSNTRIRRGDLGIDDWDRLSDGAGKAIQLPIMYETAAMDERSVERTIDIFVQKHGCSMVIVDYLQLMASASDGSYSSREQEVASQCRMLKRKAKKLNIPVIALAQLNRSLENRVDKRPVLADLRESGSLEQDADVIMFMYREEVYKKCECPGDCMCGRRGKAQVLMRKQRMGPCGDIELRWEGKTMTFRDA